MTLYLFYCYLMVLLLLNYSHGKLTCFHCRNSDDPSLCHSTEYCSTQNQVCIVSETVDQNFGLKYHLGCVDREFCNRLPLVGDQHPSRKRSLEYNCCGTTLCNNVKPTLLPPFAP